MTNRTAAFLRILLAYIAASAATVLVGLALRGQNPLVIAAAADFAATVAVFAFSVAYNNSTFYDAYWSVAPVPIAVYWFLLPAAGQAVPIRQAMVLTLVTLWAVRLTYNWARGWEGLHHEDWRYRMIREKTGKAYWPASFFGIHLFPTVQVFLGCLALYASLTMGVRPLNWIDGLAFMVTLGAIAIETVADEQLLAFAKTKKPGEIISTGLWAYSRHPNYFGEMGFWWGLWLFALAADPAYAWTVVGPLAITVMFTFASVPMLDKRSLERRAAYGEHMRRISAIVPWPPKNEHRIGR